MWHAQLPDNEPRTGLYAQNKTSDPTTLKTQRDIVSAECYPGECTLLVRIWHPVWNTPQDHETGRTNKLTPAQPSELAMKTVRWRFTLLQPHLFGSYQRYNAGAATVSIGAV